MTLPTSFMKLLILHKIGTRVTTEFMLKFDLTVEQFLLCPHSLPASTLAASHDLVQSSPLLRVTVVLLSFVAKRRNAHMTYARSSTEPKDCNICRIATPLPKSGITSSRMHVYTHTHTHSQLVSCVAVKNCVQALSCV